MLRVIVIDELRATTFKVEGKLVRDGVSEVRSSWRNVFRESGGKKKIVDLSEVLFVDNQGRELLEEMHADGATLVGSKPLISALIEEIVG